MEGRKGADRGINSVRHIHSQRHIIPGRALSGQVLVINLFFINRQRFRQVQGLWEGLPGQKQGRCVLGGDQNTSLSAALLPSDVSLLPLSLPGLPRSLPFFAILQCLRKQRIAFSPWMGEYTEFWRARGRSFLLGLCMEITLRWEAFDASKPSLCWNSQPAGSLLRRVLTPSPQSAKLEVSEILGPHRIKATGLILLGRRERLYFAQWMGVGGVSSELVDAGLLAPRAGISLQ